MSHTEGKLKYARRKRLDGMYSTELFDENGETVATAAWYPVKTENGTTTNREANARRLVACWNACEIFSTEDIERANEDEPQGRHRLEIIGDLISTRKRNAELEAENAQLKERLTAVDAILAKYPEGWE